MTAGPAPAAPASRVFRALATPAAGPLDLGESAVFLAAWELAGVRAGGLLPPGLTATSPTLVSVLAWHSATCTVAIVRLSCRSGPRARALHVGCWVRADADVRRELAEGYGLVGEEADVALRRSYHETIVSVHAGEARVEVGLTDPRPIQTADVQYVLGLHPVSVAAGARLVQVDLGFEPQRSERGRPVVTAWSLPALDPRVTPAHPVAATIAVGPLHLPRPRFLIDPELPPHVGTSAVG